MSERSSFLTRTFIPHVVVCCVALGFVGTAACKSIVYWVPVAAALSPLVARLSGLMRGIRRDYLASLLVVSLVTLVADGSAAFGAFVTCGRIG